MIKNVIVSIIALLTISLQSLSCSMFVVKKDGKAMVGNNGDFKFFVTSNGLIIDKAENIYGRFPLAYVVLKNQSKSI